MKPKGWDYKAITKAAEAEIRRLMEQSRGRNDAFMARLSHDWAYGVFLGWKTLTMGWMIDGDVERLEALVDYKVGCFDERVPAVLLEAINADLSER